MAPCLALAYPRLGMETRYKCDDNLFSSRQLETKKDSTRSTHWGYVLRWHTGGTVGTRFNLRIAYAWLSAQFALSLLPKSPVYV